VHYRYKYKNICGYFTNRNDDKQKILKTATTVYTTQTDPQPKLKCQFFLKKHFPWHFLIFSKHCQFADSCLIPWDYNIQAFQICGHSRLVLFHQKKLLEITEAGFCQTNSVKVLYAGLRCFLNNQPGTQGKDASPFMPVLTHANNHHMVFNQLHHLQTHISP